jgi:hydroxymethylbilane synthase
MLLPGGRQRLLNSRLITLVLFFFMETKIRIGTRDSQLAVWQATLVMQQLESAGYPSELIYIKSEGDIDLVTPLYAIGVQGIFTRTLDAALLSGRIDLAVHSMKDVPVQLARGIVPAAVLPRASAADLLVCRGDATFLDHPDHPATIATSSLRRKAQWLHRYPSHRIENLRGNVNTRLRKVTESEWQGAIFALAGLERIHQRPEASIILDWMLPAPAQGAIMVVCREKEHQWTDACAFLHDDQTATCVHAERTFLSELMGGCSTPVGAFAVLKNGTLQFTGNICSLDGVTCLATALTVPMGDPSKEGTMAAASRAGKQAADALLAQGAGALIQKIQASVS